MQLLRKTKQKINKRPIFAFDVETANNNKSFVLGSIIGENYEYVFYYKEDMLHELMTNKIFKNAYIFATNLSFDFFQILFNSESLSYFYTLFRGSKLIVAEAYIKGRKFVKAKTKKSYKITFLDSMNYASLSVAKMGDILHKPKLIKPDFLGDFPRSDEEYDELLTYNLQDTQITYDFMKFLIHSFEDIGATFKNTIASTSMSLFKNKYLDRDYFIAPVDMLLYIFDAYYGGRTEAFSRGSIKNMYYYDINSLYPSVMHDFLYPDPNTLRMTKNASIEHIIFYEGCSRVRVNVPELLYYPVLPLRTKDGRVIFPTGTFESTYTHIELRRALREGCSIEHVYSSVYTTKTCAPFKGFVEDLYKKRLLYKKQKNPMEYVIKILMNSLYGKFGQRFIDRDNWIHESYVDASFMRDHTIIERIGSFFRYTESNGKPYNFCIPIWAVYITAYARLRLYDYIKTCNPVYCDTDSIISSQKIAESSDLGKMKLEMFIDEGIIVRPKFYALKTKEFEYVKLKGLSKRLMYASFIDLLQNPYIAYNKFATFKEAVRRNFIPSEIIATHKEFSLEDQKRIWNDSFSMHKLQKSNPIHLMFD